MAIMTISRETGSQGHYIAEQVAQALGYRLVDKNVIARVFSAYGAGEFGVTPGYLPDFWNHFGEDAGERRERMVSMLNNVILALAHCGNTVIIGRSSFAVLSGYSDVLNVRIQAPLPVRIARVMTRQKVADHCQAEATVRESDRVRAAFIQWFYGRPWDASRSFDLVIDTGKIPASLAIHWLTDATRALPGLQWANTRTTKSILVDPSLTAIVAEELSHQAVAR